MSMTNDNNEIDLDSPMPDGKGGFTVMTYREYDGFVDEGRPLRDAHILDGWHYCHSGWDGLLIHKNWIEYEHCTCPDQPRAKSV